MLLGWQDVAFKTRLYCTFILVKHLQDITSSVHDVSPHPAFHIQQMLSHRGMTWDEPDSMSKYLQLTQAMNADSSGKNLTCVLVECLHQCPQIF